MSKLEELKQEFFDDLDERLEGCVRVSHTVQSAIDDATDSCFPIYDEDLLDCISELGVLSEVRTLITEKLDEKYSEWANEWLEQEE